MDEEISKAAKAMSMKGAAKGGRARAARLSSAERSEQASIASQARWEKRRMEPKATHVGEIQIGDLQLPCAVLSDGTRVISQRALYVSLGAASPGGKREDRGDVELPAFLRAKNLIPHVSDELAASLKMPIRYRVQSPAGGGSMVAHGIVANLIPSICDVWLKAREAGDLHYTQRDIAQKAEVLMRGLANVAIIALVDEATGYQEDRAKDELQRILDAYVEPEFRPWIRVFPEEFFRQVFRLMGWEYKAGCAKRPGYIGIFINEVIYKRLPEPVLPDLRRLNPSTNGRRRRKHHQHLTAETGIPHLDRLILQSLTLMQVSESRSQFVRHLKKVLPARGDQGEMFPESDDA